MNLTSQEKQLLWKQTKEELLGKKRKRRVVLSKGAIKRVYRNRLKKAIKAGE